MSRYSLILCAALLAPIGADSFAQRDDAAPSHRVVDAPPGSKVVGVMWDDDEVYVLVRPMKIDETPEQWTVFKSSQELTHPAQVTVRESRVPGTMGVSFVLTRPE